jgi:hypothetical protein
MSHQDRKPIELEAGWKFMEVCGVLGRRGGPRSHPLKCQGRTKKPEDVAIPPSCQPYTLFPVMLQDGITKLKKILEGEQAEVGGSA